MVDRKCSFSENLIIKKLSFVGIFGNIILCMFKFFAGFIGHSATMISDAIHSMSDIFVTIIAFFGAKCSKIKPDKEHPYGHERIECIASFVLGIILLITGLLIGYEGIKNIILHKPLLIPGKIALVAAIASIIMKELMYHYTKHWAKIINSEVFLADAWHHRADAISSIGAFIAILGARMGAVVLDVIFSVIICLFILKISFDILKDAVAKVLDTSCDEKLVENLNEFIQNQTGVIKIDVLNSRMFGSKIYIDLEIEVDGSISLKAAHEIAENVHLNVEDSFPDVKHVMVHVNPSKD